MPSTPRLFLVADASRAALWRRRAGEAGYDEVARFDNPAARLTDHALGADRPGRVFESSTGRPSAVEQGSGLHDAVRSAFAGELAAALAREAGRDEAVGVIAPARFLGLLRQALGPEVAGRVAVALDADLTRLPKAELFRRLDALAREARLAG